uniref:Uncharacterized protein n=1 Tax=Ditylenchus dipsaci TaxID=166011 RepID=A0A915DF76_9BILA
MSSAYSLMFNCFSSSFLYWKTPRTSTSGSEVKFVTKSEFLKTKYGVATSRTPLCLMYQCGRKQPADVEQFIAQLDAAFASSDGRCKDLSGARPIVLSRGVEKPP